MKKAVWSFAFLISISCFSQQNFINVPSSEVTKAGKIFFQQQINFNEIIQSNTTIDFGLKNGFEVGINVLGLNFSENQKSFIKNDSNDRDPYNPLLLLNGLKEFELTDKIDLVFGTQVGINVDLTQRDKFAGLLYGNISFKNLLGEESKIVLGNYYNSLHYGGEGNRLGVWMATEIPVFSKIHFLAESILGKNAISYTSLGIVYYPKKHIPLTFGIQIPNTKTNAFSLVFELTILPK